MRKVTLIPGDGIGPEVVDATRRIIEAAGAAIEWEMRQAGASVFMQGLATGVPDETIESIRETRVVLKGPLETPVGFGEKSANVTLRKLFETYGNIRPARELPGIVTPVLGSRHRPRGRPRERRGPLRRHRAHADARGGAVPQAHLAQGLREDRPPRLRVRPGRGTHRRSTAPPSRTS